MITPDHVITPGARQDKGPRFFTAVFTGPFLVVCGIPFIRSVNVQHLPSQSRSQFVVLMQTVYL